MKKSVRLLLFSTILLIAIIFTYMLIKTTKEKNSSLTLASTNSFLNNPFEVIDSFYWAFSNTDWNYVQAVTTPALFNYLRESGLIARWELIKKQDPSIQYVMFLVLDSHVDPIKGKAWALGRVSWKSSRRRISDYNETIFLRLINDQWKIIRIRVHPSVEVVSEFYRAIQDADWRHFHELLTERYWRCLKTTGVVRALINDRSQITSGVYVIFIATNFAESDSHAWVKGDVIWQPLSRWQKEVTVTLFLVREPTGWKIDGIQGHWEQVK